MNKINSESSLTISRTIKSDPETIYEAFVNKEQLRQWFCASEGNWSVTVHKHEPQEGGTYHIDMNSDEKSYWHKGEFREIIPNKKVVFTWNSMAVTDTLVTIALREVEGGTEVKLTHELLPDEQMKQNHRKGWTTILERLDALVGS